MNQPPWGQQGPQQPQWGPPQQQYGHYNYGPPQPPPPKKGTSIIVWLAIGALPAIFVLGSIMHALSGSAPISTGGHAPRESSLLANAKVECHGAIGNTLGCTVESTGTGDASACWDAVVDCTGGEHRGHMCSRTIPSGSKQSYTMREFSPSFGEAERCDGMRVENVTLN